MSKKFGLILFVGILIIGVGVSGYFNWTTIKSVILPPSQPRDFAATTPLETDSASLSITPTNSYTATPTKTPTPKPTGISNDASLIPPIKCEVYTYKDNYYGGNRRCLDKIWVLGVYFIPRDQKSGLQPYWSENMQNIFGQIRSFYESQFANKLSVTLNEPILVYGENNIRDYTYYTIAQEVYSKVKSTLPGGNFYADIQTFVVNGVDDKFGDNLFNGLVTINGIAGSINPSFWLSPDFLGTVTTKVGTDYSGYLGAAHEFGHSIGLPHPWEEETNKDLSGKIVDPNYGNYDPGSLMSYAGQKGPLNTYSFIREQVKRNMLQTD